jgi:predicted ATP-grasp superfamily ATP-dependent carboligase
MADILVTGLSARALASSARQAGFRPLAADLFVDLDLPIHAERCVRIAGDLSEGLAREPLLDALTAAADHRQPIGIICGTGFEDRPELLDDVARRWHIFGNSAVTVARAKDPAWLAALCAKLGIRHPRWSAEEPAGRGWLTKRRGGAGGAHVGRDADSRSVYWQEQVDGEAISALILGGAGQAQSLGLSQQWPDPLPDAPFRYGGAVRPAVLAPAVEAALEDAAERIVASAGLVGLNSVDFLVDVDRWHVIEINPRPGATLDIFAPEDGSLVGLHVEASRGTMPHRRPPLAGAAAMRTLYAPSAISAMPDLAWPDWAVDRQPPGSPVAAGAPLCTILAKAPTPEVARRLVAEHGDAIRAAVYDA